MGLFDGESVSVPRRNVWRREDTPSTSSAASAAASDAANTAVRVPARLPATDPGASAGGRGSSGYRGHGRFGGAGDRGPGRGRVLNAAAPVFVPPGRGRGRGRGGAGATTDADETGVKRPASTTWTRDGADAGAAAQSTAKKARVPGAAAAAAAATASGASDAEWIRSRIERLEREEAALRDRQLRMNLEKSQQERLDAQRKQTAAQAKAAAERKKSAAAVNLGAGFAKVLQSSDNQRRAAAAAAAAVREQNRALEQEVNRVLSAKSDAACLGVGMDADLDAIKKAYRSMARNLHPDKAKVDGATDAFQRVATAYHNLTGGLR